MQHPADNIATANAKANQLRELVQAPEILVMPGAYDALSAKLFEHMGFKAVQGSSGAIAAHFGYQDGERISRDQFIAATREMVQAVDIPVNADGEKGYHDSLGGTRETVRQLIVAGASGMNLEDSRPETPTAPRELLPVDQYLSKVRGLQGVMAEMGSTFFLNARVDSFLVDRDNHERALEEGIRRGKAYAAAGADCIFFLGVPDSECIRELVGSIPAPVSILAGPQTPSISTLQSLGVARVSYGTAFGNMAIAAVRRLANEILTDGTITSTRDASSREDLYSFLDT